MNSAWKRHWPEYLMEAAELALFMVSACLFVALLEHPSSPVRLPRRDTHHVRAPVPGMSMNPAYDVVIIGMEFVEK
ncbi:MAG TPA: hypothetical protein VJ776_00220 [Thermoanaerobaculia bacterium]|nr:hypothetical protein [Thermoanaerobaculia bacterium]